MLVPRVLLLACLVSVDALSVRGQALDIGGIELRLGQISSSALSDLRVAYDVRYEDAFKVWSVFRKRSLNDPFFFIGQLYVDDGLVTRIVKEYDTSDPYALVRTFTLAMKDVTTRGGSACFTVPAEMTDG